MIPKQLTIEGIYSYQKRQTIDFTRLTDAGLFGIFGATGSGKSSILEAISFALYGETERLNARDKRSYNMMNLKSNRAFIGFDFYNYDNTLYRVTREFKRNSKNFEDVHTPKVIFYAYKSGAWLPLEHTDAQKIINLSYHHFKRTMIIPQGKFREFLELTAAQRTRMLKDIFQLQRYDLQDKTAKLFKANQSDVDQLEGELKGYEAVTLEGIKQQKDTLNKAVSEQESVKKKHDQIDQKYQYLNHLKKDFDRLKQKREEFKKRKQQYEKYEKLEQQVNRYERLYTVFYQPLVDLKKLCKEVDAKKSLRQKKAEKLMQLQKEIDEKREALKKIKASVDELPQKRVEEEDLRFIIQILTHSAGIRDLSERQKKGEQLVQTTKEELKKLKATCEEKEEKLREYKKKRIDPVLLRQVGTWFSKWEHLMSDQKNKQKKITHLSTTLQKLVEELKTAGLDLNTFDETSKKQRLEWEKQKKRINKQKEALRVQQKLAEHAHALHEGEACPLCGATDHPHIAEEQDVSRELNVLEKELRDLEAQHKELQDKEKTVIAKREEKRQLEKQINDEREQLQQLDLAIEKQRADFVWEDFDPENPKQFKAKQEAAEELEKKIDQADQALADHRKNLEKKRQYLDRCKHRLHRLQKEVGEKQTKIDTYKSNLKHLDMAAYERKNPEEVTADLERFKKENKALEEQHQHLTEAINGLRPKISAQETELNNIKERVEELQSELQEIQDKIAKDLSAEQLSSIAEVRAVLKQQFDVSVERRKIEKFRIDHKSLENSISELKTKLAEASFSPESFKEVEESWKKVRKQLEEVNNKVVKLKEEVTRLEKDLEKKQGLEKELGKKQNRAANLKTMLNLFKGAGFVEYVSSIYLSQLCDQANVRFHRMTRHQLSLRLSEKNDFEIVDHLNEGRSRSVKTLSGGQAFQVSLALALALAENVQRNAKADKNFFFIDEGFGTQDLESVNIIFETLVNLNKENKIVGIISHVEELKDRIPQSLTIVKDAQEGSLIQIN